METEPFEDVFQYFLLKMGTFRSSMLVCQRVMIIFMQFSECFFLPLRQWEQVKEASDSRQDSEVPCSICQALRMSFFLEGKTRKGQIFPWNWLIFYPVFSNLISRPGWLSDETPGHPQSEPWFFLSPRWDMFFFPGGFFEFLSQAALFCFSGCSHVFHGELRSQWMSRWVVC